MALERAVRHDFCELGNRMPHLGLRVEEVRAEPDPARRIWAEVADDPALSELGVAGGVVGGRDGDRAAAALGLPRRDDLEPGLVTEVDQELREPERALADPGQADLLDHVVAGGRGVQGGYVRRAGEEAPRPRRVLELGLERERPGVSLPADERGL